MSDYREQAIRDVAEATLSTASDVERRLSEGDYYPLTVYAVSRQEHVLELEAELKLQKGANAAQDERERRAAEQLGMVHNCDWPDAVADRVRGLEAELKQWRGCGWAQYDGNTSDPRDALGELSLRSIATEAQLQQKEGEKG